MLIGNRRPGPNELSVFNPIMVDRVQTDPCDRMRACWNRSLEETRNVVCHPRTGAVIVSGVLIGTLGFIAIRGDLVTIVNGALSAFAGLLNQSRID